MSASGHNWPPVLVDWTVFGCPFHKTFTSRNDAVQECENKSVSALILALRGLVLAVIVRPFSGELFGELI